MNKQGFLYRAYHLYADGFRSMTLGRTLWAIILIKLFVIFVLLKLFFVPNFIKEHAKEGEEPEFVATQVINRASTDIASDSKH
jgi:competence protein ComGC